MKERTTGLLLVFPAMLMILAILILPLAYTLYCSLFRLDYLQFGAFQGLKNYQTIINNPEVYQSMRVTMVVTVCATGISMTLGLALALWIDRKRGPFAYAVQLVGLLPWVISMMVGTLLWRWILNGDTSLFNYVVQALGFKPLMLFNDKVLSTVSLILVMAWRTVGYSMVMLLAGLKGLPGVLVEAAHVDGANALQTLIKVKLPLIKTPLLVSTIVLTMSNFNNNTVPMVLTNGGPSNATNVITLFLYKLSFSHYKFGLSSALSTMLFVVNMVMILIYVKLVKYEI